MFNCSMTIRLPIRTWINSLALIGLLAPLTGCVTSRNAGEAAKAERTKALLGVRATYCAAPRKADARVDVDLLIAQLVEMHANT